MRHTVIAVRRLEVAIRLALSGALLGLALLPVQGIAQQTDNSGATAPKDVLEEVVVFGRGEELIGKASAASEGEVGGDDLLVRPMLRVADLLEAVPGLIAAQHSGSGKANQYFLRGFNLDHGTDFTSYIDDVPWNLRTHGHGQGYLDVNGLIPEVVERIEYRKGPYRADNGDFSMAGASLMTTIDMLSRPFVAVEGGQYGWGRVAGGGTTQLGNGMLTVLGQYKTYDGPWELKENLQHESVWGKYSQSTEYGLLKVSLSGYHATWNPTEQMPESAIGQVVIGAIRFVLMRSVRSTPQQKARLRAGLRMHSCCLTTGALRLMRSITTGACLPIPPTIFRSTSLIVAGSLVDDMNAISSDPTSWNSLPVPRCAMTISAMSVWIMM